MQIVINTRGSYLRKEHNCFLIKNEDRTFEVSAEKVDSILITTSATISTDAIEFAVANNIDIVFLNRYGNPYGRIWHPKLGSTTLIRRRQLEMGALPEGFVLVRGWVARKLRNQIEYLRVSGRTTRLSMILLKGMLRSWRISTQDFLPSLAQSRCTGNGSWVLRGWRRRTTLRR